jgi:hypothetical protein
MGDKSPKAMKRGKDQKSAANTQSKDAAAKRQADFATPAKAPAPAKKK